MVRISIFIVSSIPGLQKEKINQGCIPNISRSQFTAVNEAIAMPAICRYHKKQEKKRRKRGDGIVPFSENKSLRLDLSTYKEAKLPVILLLRDDKLLLT